MNAFFVVAWLLASPSPFDPPPARVQFEAAPGALNPLETADWQSACLAIAQSLGGPPQRRWRVEVIRSPTIEAFTRATGRARFDAAAVEGDRLYLQNRKTLARFPSLTRIRRHECVHLWLRAAGVPPLPRIFEEAIAVGLAGQISELPFREPLRPSEINAAEAILRRPQNPKVYREELARAVASFWPLIAELSPKARGEALRTIGAAPSDWLSIELPSKKRLSDGLRHDTKQGSEGAHNKAVAGALKKH